MVISARRRDRLDALVADLGERAHAVVADVGIDADCARLVAEATAIGGRLDILVNNAGIAASGPAESEPIETFRNVVDVNLGAVFLVSQLAFESLQASGHGSVVNVASVLGLVASTPIKQASYCASKGAVVNLTRELGCQWARKGVRVNALAPGWFPSEMTADMWEHEGTVGFINKNTPIGRGGREHELDGVLLFLASDASSFMIGQTIVVDGGWTAR